jgi:hypothetical protein
MDVETLQQIKDKRILGIGIDLDDTLNNYGNNFINFVNDKYKTNYDYNLIEEYNYANFFDKREDETQKLFNEFEDLYIEKLEPLVNSFDVLFNLKKDFNCKLYIITSRSERIRKQTEEWINLHYPNIFEGIEFGNNYDNNPKLTKRTKYQMCKSRDINIIIDDRYEIISDKRLFGILFERPWSSYKDYIYRMSKWTFSLFKNLFKIKIKNTLLERNPIIIGLSGKIGAGKNAIGDIILKEFNFLEECAFANRLKETVSAMTNTNLDLLFTQEGKSIIPSGFKQSLGQLLQIVGDITRNNIDEDIWVNCVLETNCKFRHIVITDVRQRNEFYGIKKKKGIILRTEGDPFLVRKNNYAKRDLNHSTETALDNYKFDFIIENNGTKELREFIDKYGVKDLYYQEEELKRLKKLSLEELKAKVLFVMYPILINDLY